VEEIWKSIPEFEGYYEASSLGRIRSLDVIRTAPNGGEWVKKGQILKPRVINDFGHLGVKLSVNGVKCDRTVHYLVATAFHGERPEGLLIRHLDGRPSNNAPSISRMALKSTTWLTPLHTIPLSLVRGATTPS
jgi:hypothetical protein